MVRADDYEYVESETRAKQLTRAYGLPNAIDVGYGLFHTYTGRQWVDDDRDGAIVAYAPNLHYDHAGRS